MKRFVFFVFFLLILVAASLDSPAQCSICTKNTQQLGEKPAKGLNAGILYLAFAPFAIVGYIGYRWLKANREA